MKPTPESLLPKDTEKLGHKLILDTLREQLLKKRTIEETPEETSASLDIDLHIKVEFPENKKFFRIGEVAELIGVEAYVLRYWESEFGSIRPKKSRSGQRIFDRKDVQLLALVHHLLHVQKFSIQGAKQKLSEMRKNRRQAAPIITAHRQALESLAREVESLIRLVEQGPFV